MTADSPPKEHPPRPTRLPGGLASPARALLLLIAVTAASLSWIAAAGIGSLEPREWVAFAVIGAGAALAQLFPVVTPHDQSYHTTMMVLVPAALLLPAWLLPAIVIAQHLPEWLRVRYPWYIQAFNASNYLVDLFAAAAVAGFLLREDRLIPNDGLRFAVAGLAAAAVLVMLNHFILSVMLRLARGHSLRESGLFSFESVSTDLVLAALGVLVAFAWEINPALIPFAIAPLLLIQRSLAVPQLEREARLDPKTGLFNVRHFSAVLNEQLEESLRNEQPLALLMIDLDLLREINNTYGHLAGDAVLERIADVFRRNLRADDVAARFGGEEFVLLLPDTELEHALALAERVREAVGRERVDVAAISETLSATVSIGVAMCPRDGTDPGTLIHRADLAVYRAKIQGRNRVVDGGAEPLADPLPNTERRAPPPIEQGRGGGAPVVAHPPTLSVSAIAPLPPDPGDRPAPAAREVAVWASFAGVVLTALGAAVTLVHRPADIVALLTLAALVAGGQALALQAETGDISVGAVGALAGAALIGGGGAVVLALAAVATGALIRRPPFYTSIYNLGVLTVSGLGAAIVLSFGPENVPMLETVAFGVAAGAGYYVVNTSLLSLTIAMEEGRPRLVVWKENFAWLLPHYLAYGFVGAVVAIAYEEVHIYALAVFLVPLVLIRATQLGHLRASRESSERLREAADTIHRQNVSLEEANRLLRRRSTEALEGLSATVDARDAYTAGHSRRVREISLRIGEKIGLSQGELEMLGHVALFHDIGKIAVPDAILMKPGALSPSERSVMQIHSEEGAEIVSRLGFLADAVPAIRHHHENFDGTGYPAALAGVDIPLGARIIHVADALDAMMNGRVYRAGRSLEDALGELRRRSGTQFCPRCVEAAVAVAERDASIREALAAVG
jgi:diguanylate cyclase (GGDEF)-like protein/putative nucleotidyltransferase with HDIG domain